MKKYAILFILTFVILRANALNWYDGSSVSYHINGNIDPVVSIALQMFSDDMMQVTGQKAKSQKNDAMIEIVQTDKSSRRNLDKWGIPVDKLTASKDAFYVAVKNGKIVVAGNNGRGTAYGILELSRMAGVSPWIWWNDSKPEKKSTLTIPDDYETFQSPSVEYRGIFLNDEDWSSRRWSNMTFEQGQKFGYIGPKTYKKIFQLLLRLRANTIWPGMHTGTIPFFQIPGNKAIADSCGIVVGTSHCEPLLRNNVGEWDVDKRGRYNYITNRDEVQKYWIERLKETKGGDYLYTIGMRGIHDGSMEGVKTLQEKTTALQQVIDDQRKLIGRYVDKDVEKVPQVFVPYKEVLQIMENGLRVPDDVTLMWCDDNYGYMTRLSDSLQQQRSGGAGVYYHLSYWGRPHDYLWLTTTQPGLIYKEMREAYDHNAQKLWIVNVHDVKVAAYDLEFFLDMAWNINSITPNTINNHLQNWLCREFGEKVGMEIAPVMKEWYRLTSIRKPEFMGWTQVELDKRLYPRGRSQVIDTEFTKEFGDETNLYLENYSALCDKIDEIKQMVRKDQLDDYFAAVEYPVKASQAMAEKMLYAQKARQLYMGQTDASMLTRRNAAQLYAAKSQEAYKRINQLTSYYNESLAGGKWNGIMNAAPRDLYVFYPPLVPEWIDNADSIVNTASQKDTKTIKEDKDKNYYAFNATDYSNYKGQVESIEMLGHSMNALSISKGTSVQYSFFSNHAGEATLYVAMIPTQPNDKGDLRFSVSVDGGETQTISLKEPFRSETWKKNVLRGQALKEIDVNLKKGRHTITVTALDNHVILDQLMVDFKKNRKFYMIPALSQDVMESPLNGKTIAFIGDSYVANHRRPISESWHYKFAKKYGMKYLNYGRNGSCVSTGDSRFGKAMYKRYKDIDTSADYIVIIAGHNDSGRLDSTITEEEYKKRLNEMLTGMKSNYPNAKIMFISPWNCANYPTSKRKRIVDITSEICKNYNIPFFNAAEDGTIKADDDSFRSIYFQSPTDKAHLNSKGHDLFEVVAEKFILGNK